MFPGLNAGDRWCLWCALEGGARSRVAPPVWLLATHERALDVVTIDQLAKHALDLQ